ncbi:MAG: Ig-like domain-containing protein, partial [candidate division Zixibacteria bacterium]|nr:Ig-like domain-containing protein [candidate division Zixibacteria bacterium]
MKGRLFLIVFVLSLLSFGQVLGMDFRAAISGPGASNEGGGVWKIKPNLPCTLNVYATNNDTIGTWDPGNPLYSYRSTWSSPFQFTGTIAVQWTDPLANSAQIVTNAVTRLKYMPANFISFFDMLCGVYPGSFNGTLPDTFNLTGIASGNAYPFGLGEILIAHWGFSTSSTSGTLCIDSTQIFNGTYDWVFDEPQPGFPKTCWDVKTNQPPVLGVIGPKSVNEGAILNFNIIGTDPDTDPLTFSSGTLPPNATLTNNGNGTATFNFAPDFTQSGSYPVWFIVSDGIVPDSENVVITVTNVDTSAVYVCGRVVD